MHAQPIPNPRSRNAPTVTVSRRSQRKGKRLFPSSPLLSFSVRFHCLPPNQHNPPPPPPPPIPSRRRRHARRGGPRGGTPRPRRLPSPRGCHSGDGNGDSRGRVRAGAESGPRDHGARAAGAPRDGGGAGGADPGHVRLLRHVGPGPARLRADRGRPRRAAGPRRVQVREGAAPRLRPRPRWPRRVRGLQEVHGRQGARALPHLPGHRRRAQRLHPPRGALGRPRQGCLLLAGIEIDDEELARFVEHVDKDNNGIITFEEWRDFLMLYPNEATIENIYHHWERVCLVDIGEQAAIPEGLSKHVSASKYLIAGGIAGAASRTATAPLDRLKVIMQVQTTRTTVAHAVKDIFIRGGLLGFFRGNGLNVVKVAPESAIRFYAYETLKEYIMNSKGENKSAVGASERLVAGGLAGAVAQTAIYPIDLVKTRLQTFSCVGGKVPSLGTLSRDIWMHEGPRAFYRGLVPSLLGIVPYAGIDLAVYETLKDASRTYILKDSDPGPLVQLGCGTVSGALGATCVYPLQVIRTRLQAQRANSESAYRGMSDVFWRTLQHEGISGFYKGILPNLLKVVPAASITYLVYEAMKKNLSLD
ncbi:hypothetical protein BRADI_1g36572v3 [Brachypodium distachyon]|uniref:EF-hand domain-containing protein n=2 Tax=Brachypodium distachyon TaxID=15368 RepID=A0A0Q3L3P2_BRADI|nr:hypothetical protein BRADI_1g36572v3 [Brachypodium distachyon]KQK17760.1 hypothetical protein BRADI_1g36572v3 [Brachypodium distachyon]KQK17761.1 hypothetical protein BRADI_1g36572v3 [Brachypodium distachyon]KQK17762.1 hypothetical protein BRADI_1g36572v3 [Brachypodium distachyon]